MRYAIGAAILTGLVLALALYGCNDIIYGGDDDSAAGDDAAGDDAAGDDTAGDDTAGDDTAGDDTAGDDTGSGPTWTNFADQFMQSFCTRCHKAGGSATPALETYDEVVAAKTGVKNVAGTGSSMPPSAPTPSAQERQELTAWIDAGCPQ